MTFGSLIAPLDQNEFFQSIWEAKEVFLPPVTVDKFKDLLSISDLGEYLSRNDLRYPCLRLAQDGKELALSSYAKQLKFGDYSAPGLIEPDKVMDCYNRGATIAVQLAHISLPSLSKLAVGLESELEYNVQMTVYLTPPNSQGFTAHYDTHNVFVAQLSGSKTWRIYDFEKKSPLLTDHFDQSTFIPGESRNSYNLTPGSLLYVPRGLVHDARANVEPSLHVTIGLFPPLWIDLFFDHLRKMELDERFRKSPFWSSAAMGDEEKRREELQELLQLFIDKFEYRSLREDAIKRSISGQIQNNENRLIDLIRLPSLNIISPLKVRAHLRTKLYEDHQNIFIRCFDKEIRLNKQIGSLVKAILDRPNIFRISELEFTMSDDDKIKLCAMLIKNGLLTMV